MKDIVKDFRQFILGESCNSQCSVTTMNESEGSEDSEKSKGTHVLEQSIYFSDLSDQLKDSIRNRIELAGGDVVDVLNKEFPITLKIYFNGTSDNITEASEEDIKAAFKVVGGTVVDGKGLEFESPEEVKSAKSQLDQAGISSYTSNRTPLTLFIGMPATTATGKYGMGPFAAEILKAVETNPSAKKELDKLVSDKKGEVKTKYTGSDLETLFSRMELKKYSKTIPSIPNTDEGEEELDRGEIDAKLMEFQSMFKEYDNPVDMIITKFKEGENVVPYIRTFLRKDWLKNPKEVLSVAKANGITNYDALVAQLDNL